MSAVNQMDTALRMAAPELLVQLEAADAVDLRKMRAHIGRGTAGTRAENIKLIVQHAAQLRLYSSTPAEDAPPSTPERRSGRARSPHRHPAASGSSHGAAGHDHRQLSAAAAAGLAPVHAASLAPHGPSQATISGVTVPLPASMDVDPLVENDPWRQFRPKAMSPELARKRGLVEALLADTDAPAPLPLPLPAVPALPGGGSETDTNGIEAKFGVLMDSMSSLITGVNELRAVMPNVVTRQDLREINEKQREEFETLVYSHVEPVKALARDFDCRVSALENVTRPPGPDPAYKRIAFLGLPDDADPDARVGAVSEFIAKYVPKVNFVAENIYRGSFKLKTRKLTTVAYAEFASSDTRDRVLEIISKQSMTFQTKKIDVKRSLTQSAAERNYAIREAFKVISDDLRVRGRKPEKVFAGERGVTIDGVYVFSQGKIGSGEFH